MEKTARRKKLRYPSKVTVNLVMRERSGNSPRIVLPLFLVLAVLIGVFAKFAVIDRLAVAARAQAGLAAAQAELAQAQAANEAFDSVAAEYSRYFYSGFTEAELGAVDRMEILGLLETELMPRAQIGAMAVKGNVMTVNLSGVTLQGLSDLMRQLKDQDLVSGVSVYTAGTRAEQSEGAGLASVVMTITLAQDGKGDAP